MPQHPVTGRFAPSPTGSLHFGSLVAAVGSYLEAKCTGGSWLLRIEDIDPPREVAGSSAKIIADLHRFGMYADEPALYQSDRILAYQKAVEDLVDAGRAYPCACSRKDLPASGIYPGTCRNGIPAEKTPRAIRFRLDDGGCEFTDGIQGRIHESPATSCGDFIIKRADGLFAYQLAVVVDDDFQGITQVVRGADLLDSTCRQIALQQALGFESPRYMHLPVALSGEGKKMSKRDQSDPVKHQDPAYAVFQALHFLGQKAPADSGLEALWAWALEHWDNSLIARQKEIMPARV
ncbi:MAG: tRNA glutamyl-Q(34) synthetase GluQRS [Xanthomonadales bacterium]|nr:tRNA glutamyl-Q(34) synthetase GluQRS [Xanthomonadales bacterium]